MSPRPSNSDHELNHSGGSVDQPLSADGKNGIDPFFCFHSVTAEWFRAVFDAPTAPQRLGWPVISRGESQPEPAKP